ncbi:MAG TPA: hypothetical protein VHH33_05185 [Nitrososphaeraceae archaeon]|jgi:hypothetical protein|nr:hypothetical protein [Nitrososphaeraceae archaeon]
MTINDFVFSCASDDVPAYFTYEGQSMVIVQSKEGAKNKKNDFEDIEGFMSALISHESVHVIIAKLVNNQISDSLDDVEIIVERYGKKFQVSLNNMFFSTDFSGIITS